MGLFGLLGSPNIGATQYDPEEVLISLMINMNPGCPQFSKMYNNIKIHVNLDEKCQKNEIHKIKIIIIKNKK